MNTIVPEALLGSVVERVVPESSAVSEHLVREHVKRYQFAAPIVKGLKVLDIACGSGYGAYKLAETASSVVGVDLEAGAVTYARKTYARANLSFREGNAQDLNDYEANSFDAVVSFETIEHLPDYRSYLLAVRRVLRPDGIYIVSTPDAEFATKSRLPPTPLNPYHIHEFEFDELRSLLQTMFQSVTFYGQQYYVEPSPPKKLLQRAALLVLASPIYQRFRYKIPSAILNGGVSLSGIDNNNDICPLGTRVGTPEILLALCR